MKQDEWCDSYHQCRWPHNATLVQKRLGRECWRTLADVVESPSGLCAVENSSYLLIVVMWPVTYIVLYKNRWGGNEKLLRRPQAHIKFEFCECYRDELLIFQYSIHYIYSSNTQYNTISMVKMTDLYILLDDERSYSPQDTSNDFIPSFRVLFYVDCFGGEWRSEWIASWESFHSSEYSYSSFICPVMCCVFNYGYFRDTTGNGSNPDHSTAIEWRVRIHKIKRSIKSYACFGTRLSYQQNPNRL